jgi:hypothetical protein
MSPSSLQSCSEFHGCHAVTTVYFSECVCISCCICNLRLQYIQALLLTCTVSKVHASELGKEPHSIRRLGFRILRSIPSRRFEARSSAILQHKPRHIHPHFSRIQAFSILFISNTITKSAIFAPKSGRILIRPAVYASSSIQVLLPL